MVELTDLALGDEYWIDRAKLKQFLRLRGLYPTRQKWIPLQVIITDLNGRLDKEYGYLIGVYFKYAEKGHSKTLQVIPLNTLVRKVKHNGK